MKLAIFYNTIIAKSRRRLAFVRLHKLSKREILDHQLRWLEAQQHCEVGSSTWKLCSRMIRKAARELAGRY